MARAILFFLLISVSLSAQEFISPPEVLSERIIKRVDEVFLTITATDRKGRFVSDMRREDLHILDNHLPPVRWTYFGPRTDLPLRVILMIDTSGSVTSRFRFEQQAATAFLRRVLRPGVDEAGVIQFDSAVRELQPLTGDIDKIVAGIDRARPGDATVFYDAVVLGAGKLAERRSDRPFRRVLLVISDGMDNGSHASLQAAESAALKSEAVILSVNSRPPASEKGAGDKILKDLAASTGGFVLPAQENYELKKAFQKAETFLRNQYAVGYAPMNFKADGRFRPIEVKAARHGLKLHTRQGYFAPQN
jgi:VWFA-related protein